jgi:hypothetical protein
MRGVEDIKNGKGVAGLRGIGQKVELKDNNVDDKENREFMARVWHNVALPEYTLFGMFQSSV